MGSVIATVLLTILFTFSAEAEEEIVSVGAISCNDGLLHVHITNLLSGHGILAVFPGSVLHSIDVPVSRQKEAAKIVREDALKRGYSVYFGKQDATPDHLKLTEMFDRVAFKKVLALPAYSSQTTLGRFLRRKDIVEPTTKYPYIYSLEVAARRYLATPKKLRTGYIVKLSLRETRVSPSGLYSFETYFIDHKGHDLYYH